MNNRVIYNCGAPVTYGITNILRDTGIVHSLDRRKFFHQLITCARGAHTIDKDIWTVFYVMTYTSTEDMILANILLKDFSEYVLDETMFEILVEDSGTLRTYLVKPKIFPPTRSTTIKNSK